jgi:CheY-like chemotaxis protein
VAALALRQRPESESRFEGKLAYEQTIREMQSLEGKPLALVIGGSGDLRDNLSKHLSLLGVRTLGASSGRESLRLIQEPQPIEYVFLVDRVIDMSLSELVQRLRASPRTSWLPMAVMTDQIGPTQREILQDSRFQAIHYSTLTSNIDFTATLFSEMRQRSPLPRMDAIDRLSFRAIVEPVAKSK